MTNRYEAAENYLNVIEIEERYCDLAARRLSQQALGLVG